jgi:glutathione S-transferase
LDAARIDAVYENVRDVKAQWFKKVKGVGEGDEAARRAARAQWFAVPGGDLCALCQALEASLPPPSTAAAKATEAPRDGAATAEQPAGRVSASGWCVGGAVSLADVAVYHLLATPTAALSGATESFFDGEGGRVRACLAVQGRDGQRCPRLLAVVAAFGALPRIRAWEASRPDTFT